MTGAYRFIRRSFPYVKLIIWQRLDYVLFLNNVLVRRGGEKIERGKREREGEIASEGEATALFVARRIIRGRKEGKENENQGRGTWIFRDGMVRGVP